MNGAPMDLLRTLALRIRTFVGAPALERELDDELRFHVDMQTETYIRSGMTPARARRRALTEFGGVDRMTEACRDTRTGSRLHTVLRAVRLAIRRLRREPAFVVPAVATIAIGVAALTAVFTLADAVLLRPLAYPDADRIVEVRHTLPGWGIPASGQSGGTFAHYQAGSTAFASLGAWFDRELSITEGDNPERIQAALVTPGVLRVLGVQPVIGRAFNDEDAGGAAVLLSHEMWHARYNADPHVIGRTVSINRVEREIIGVLPPRTDFPRPGTQMLFGMGPGIEATRGELDNLYMEAIGRLRPGVTLDDAEADLARLIATLPERYGDVTPAQLAESGIAPRVRSLKESITGDVRPALILLLCTAFIVLLIAMANVANLVMVRAEHQRREVAIERALGAGHGAIAGRFIAEYALLTLMATALGLLLAHVAVQTRLGFDAWQIPRLHDAALGGRSYAVAAVAALTTAALLAATGIGRTRGVDVQAALKGSLQRATTDRDSLWLQHGLSAVQVALACALLIAAGVMVQSVARLQRLPLGFAPANVLAFDVALPNRQYQGYTVQASFHDALAERLRRVPGVDAVGAVTVLPLTLTPNWADAPVVAADAPRPDVAPMMTMRSATPEYFAAMGIPILRGRTFEAADLRDDGAGVILSAALARVLFGSIDVVGRRIELPNEESVALTIIGVAGDIRDATLTAPPARLLYLPSVGAAAVTDGRADIPVWPGEMSYVVRSALPLQTLLPAVRSALKEMDATLPVAYPRTIDELVSRSSARARMTSRLLLASAGAALLLGVVGIYGVIAYAVRRRTPELALRMVLGATPRGVTAMVLRQGAVIALAGIGAGIGAALALTRLLRGLLFEVSAHDPVTFVAGALVMLLVALAASGLPAVRAARTPPSSALADN
jgi:putative ABC transport system permease protein